jgi:ribokinase
MGAGFAAALGGSLVSALGRAEDPTTRAVSDRLAGAGVAHHTVTIPDRPSDWTLLVTSGEYGDKLPIGFRGCHLALKTLSPWSETPCDLRVVASLPNRLAADVLRAPGAAVRVFAPAMRNVMEGHCPVSSFAAEIDVLCCNRHEWESLADREEVAWQVSVLAITEGPEGSLVRFTNLLGEPVSLRVPPFPRSHPPLDTNRAGEAYAATLVTTLLEGGWSPGVADESLVRHAARRASAAAALVLDRPFFGFPAPEEIDAALREGHVA